MSRPIINITKSPASLALSAKPQRVLLIGQKTSAGSATSGALISEIGNDNSWNTYFGENSILAAMCRNFRLLNEVTRMDAIGLDDGGGAVAATGSVTFGTGPASAAGQFVVEIASTKNHSYTIAVANTDTVTDIGDALVAAITADTKCPVAASNASGVVTLTAVNKGTIGNYITIKASGSAAGVTLASTNMSGGATDPTLTNIFDVIGSLRYQTIVFPSQYGYTFITNLLDPRWNATNAILDGVGITSLTDTLANIKSAANTENTQNLFIHANKKVAKTLYNGSALLELDYVISSQIAAYRSLRLTEDANISSINVSTGAPLDNFGGPAQASKPYFNIPFSLLPLIDQDEEWTETEIGELNDAGASVLVNNDTRTSIIANDFYTTYKTDAASNPNTTWEYLNQVDTHSACAEYFFNNLKARYSQHRLTEGDLLPGRAMTNENNIRSFCKKLYSDLAGEDYVLVQAGREAVEYFMDNLDVTLDIQNQKVTINAKLPIVVQAREFIVDLQVSFTTNS